MAFPMIHAAGTLLTARPSSALDIMVTTSTSTKSTISKSTMTRVSLSLLTCGQSRFEPTDTDADTREEDLTHPEDIAHFAKHDADADAADRQEQLDRMPIVEHNIPQKFRRVQ